MSKRELPGQAENPETYKPGMILRHRKHAIYLRVVKVSGRLIYCQSRQGKAGRFADDTRPFVRTALDSLYKLVA